MKFKRYAKKIVIERSKRSILGYRMKLYFRSSTGMISTLASQVLYLKDIKSKDITATFKRKLNMDTISGKLNKFLNPTVDRYTPEFRAEMERHASRIAGITELGQ